MISILGGKTSWVAAAATAAGALAIGYCIYFDAKRHQDPNFKKNLKEKRRRSRREKATGRIDVSVIPDLRDPGALQRFWYETVQRAEDFLTGGNIEKAVESYGLAIAVSSNPHQLLLISQQTLPPTAYRMLLMRLPMIRNAVFAYQEAKYGVSIRHVHGGIGDTGMPMGGMPMQMDVGGGLGPSVIREISLDDELE